MGIELEGRIADEGTLSGRQRPLAIAPMMRQIIPIMNSPPAVGDAPRDFGRMITVSPAPRR